MIGNRYQRIRLLGKGGMGEVWCARSLKLDIDVAVKLVRRDCNVPNAHERLEREARLAARVIHPAAVRVIDHDNSDVDGPFLVMELLRGQSLRARLTQSGPMSPLAAVQLMLPVIGALAAAHRQGIVHRDVNPSNILLVEDGSRLTPKLIDFGIACPLRGGHGRRLTAAGLLLGTVSYTAPEQLLHGAEPDARVDVWSVCLTLVEMMGGVRPSMRRNGASLLQGARALLSSPGAPGEHRALFEILARGLASSPDDRHATMAALGGALAGWAMSAGATWDVTRTSLTAY